MKNILLKFKLQQGQTLIETLAALFILVMGISSAVGLAVYAFGSSTEVTKEIIATGLARQGLEAVKNMRDTNWLSQSSINTNCYNFASSTEFNASCYNNWLNQTFCLDPANNTANACAGPGTGASSTNYSLGFSWSGSLVPNFWVLDPQVACGNSCKYGLLFDPNLTATGGFYNLGPAGITCTDGASQGGLNISDYCRKIIISTISNVAPYNQNTGPLLKVQAQVWWIDKKCPRSADWPGLGKCSVELDTYLTNWKNY